MPQKVVTLATRKGLLIYVQKSSGWHLVNESFVGVGVSLSEMDPRDGSLYAMLDHGHYGCKLHRWDGFLGDDWTAQDNWVELAPPAYPEGSKLKDGNDAVLKYQWAMSFGTTGQPGRVYIGTEPGGLFFSEDRCDMISLCRSLWDHPSRLDDSPGWMGGGRDHPGLHSICVDPDDENTVRIGISCAGVFESNDSLGTWQVRNKGLRADFMPDPNMEIGHDPHLLVQCESEPDKLWQQNHCGIFRSTDRGCTWSDVSEPEGPARFGFTIVVNPTNGDQAWVVPAVADQNRVAVDRALCVCMTEDGGRSWTSFREGLPQLNCYDFVLRHCLYASGANMVMGTVGGSFYFSADFGESWELVNGNLPLIYGARIYEV